MFTVMLTLVFCLTAVFPVAAAPPGAKDLVLAAVHNFDMGMDPGFYEKSEGKGAFEVTRFGGAAKDAVGDLTGAAVEYSAAMDTARDAMKMSFDLQAGDIARQADIYMVADKLILTKGFFLLLQDLGADVFAEVDPAITEVPEFMYWADPQFATIWEQMADYKNGKLPAQYAEWLAFFVEAVPAECFTLSPTKVTMRLDEDGLTDTAVNLLAKVKNESERVAELLLAPNRATFEQMGLDPEDVKQEMIIGMEKTPLLSRDEVKAAMGVVDIKDFSLTYSLLPGGPKALNVDLGFTAPDGSMGGSFVFTADAAGTKENLEGTYRMAASFSAADGPDVAAAFDGKVNYKGKKAYSESTIDVTAKDNATGELLLDLGLAESSVTEVKPGLKLKVPALTAENSLDLTHIIPITGSALAAPGEPGAVVINGVTVEGAKMGKDGQFMVPARVALEPMGYTVHWVPPNTLRVLGDAIEFTLTMDQKGYLMDGVKKELYAAPCLDDGTAMVPLGFLASEEIGADIGF